MLVSQFTQGLGHCRAPFNPGAVIDDEGTGWLSFGGGGKGEVGTDYMPGDARIVRLGKDLISLDSEIVEIKAPYHFEANELNYWNYGMGFSNNHTHLQKYKGDYYLFYHNMCLQEHKGTNGGFRSLCVNKLKVDEKNVKLEMGEATPGNMLAVGSGQKAGHGTLEVHLDRPDGEVLASTSFNSDSLQTVSTKIDTDKDGIRDLYFVFKGKELKVDEWMFERF